MRENQTVPDEPRQANGSEQVRVDFRNLEQAATVLFNMASDLPARVDACRSDADVLRVVLQAQAVTMMALGGLLLDRSRRVQPATPLHLARG